MKWLAFVLLVVLFAAANSCTTLVNRRDLYSPEPAPDAREVAQRMTTTTTTTTTRTEMRGSVNPREETPPEFR